MNVKEYKSKVRGCWLGKNIGGSLGAPFECKRGVFNVEYYTHDFTKGVLPNDDLDLQLVWLNAAENYGKALNAAVLAEYWLSYVTAEWSEYGAGKTNLASGLLPPISGSFSNHNKDSCGCFIRSEIWACLAPGNPDITVKYAYEDAIVDHGGEGVYAEIFCAALQSAAFAESDTQKLIDIGLSYIPDGCDTALAVKTAVECYKTGLDWKAARKKVLQTVPGAFGMNTGYEDREPEPDVPVGELGYDAPSNIGLMIVGWLYGEGDFGKSICISASCGEDADCTAATLGSILGIICGAENIPQKWLEPIGDEIKTLTVNLTDWTISIPGTVTELCERVCALMPVFMGGMCDTMNENGVQIKFQSNLYCQKYSKGVFARRDFKDTMIFDGVKTGSAIFDVTVRYTDGIYIENGAVKKMVLNFENKINKQQCLKVKWHMPPEWTVSPSRESMVILDQRHGGTSLKTAECTITAGEIDTAVCELILEIKSNGRPSTVFVPITFFCGRGEKR